MLRRGQSQLIETAILVTLAIAIASGVVAYTYAYMNQQRVPPAVLQYAESAIRVSVVSTQSSSTAETIDLAIVPAGGTLPVRICISLVGLNSSGEYWSVEPTEALTYVPSTAPGLLEPGAPLNVTQVGSRLIILPATTGNVGYETAWLRYRVPALYTVCVPVSRSPVFLELGLPVAGSSYTVNALVSVFASTGWGELYVFKILKITVP